MKRVYFIFPKNITEPNIQDKEKTNNNILIQSTYTYNFEMCPFFLISISIRLTQYNYLQLR